MKFQVPQFIEIEDKLFGPLTFKQFVYLAGGGGISFLLWQSLPLIAAVPLILAVVSFSTALAFLKINKRPFINALEAAFHYFIRDKLYTWKKNPRKKAVKKAKQEKKPDISVPRVSKSSLKEIAWNLDVQESIYKGAERERKRQKESNVIGKAQAQRKLGKQRGTY